MQNSDTGKRRLGRGLSGLIKTPESVGKTPISVTENVSQNEAESQAGTPIDIPADTIAANPHQPRRSFDPEQLKELTDSIRQQGILQPLIVTPARGDAASDGKDYVLIAGERRLRAAREAGLQFVPCVIRDASEQQMIEWAMIENIQRSDLNPMERAVAYRDYMDRFSLSQAQVAERMGQSRSAVANYVRLLDLCDEVQSLIAEQVISFGHAKVLAGITGQADRQRNLAKRIVRDELSVRKLEELIRQPAKAEDNVKTGQRGTPTKPAHVRDMEQQLTETVGTKVTIQPGRKANTGKIILEYYSLEDFERLAETLGWEVERLG
jgi:ParB family chromosome partitioning protein